MSAYGAVVSDVTREYRRVFLTTSRRFDRGGAEAVIAALRQAAELFVRAAGAAADDTRIDLTVEARYPHQVWEIDVPIDAEQILAPDGPIQLEAIFHKAHEQIFAFADPGSPIEIIAWRAAVRCQDAYASELALVEDTADAPQERERQAYFARGGWQRVPVLGFAALAPDRAITGPAIVKSPFTSIVITPGSRVWRTRGGNLAIAPAGTQSEPAGNALAEA